MYVFHLVFLTLSFSLDFFHVHVHVNELCIMQAVFLQYKRTLTDLVRRGASAKKANGTGSSIIKWQ